MGNILQIKTHDKHKNYLFINESSTQFRINYGKNSFWKETFATTDWYNVNKIIELSLIESEVLKTKSNLGKIIATGLLFGPIGAIAGSLGNNQKSFSNILYSVRFTLDDIKLAVVDLHCNDVETALRVINTIKLLKAKKINEKKKNKLLK
jgi:hypothetical protein